MKRKMWLLTVALISGMLLMGGCGDSKKNVYEQAGKDLDQGYYEYALEGYKEVIASGNLLPEAYRGAGIANLRMDRYENAITNFTNAIAQKTISKALRKDLISYRATAYLKAGKNKKALADCQTLAEEFGLDANGYFLTGMVTLEMDSYEQARSNFDQAYAANPTYDMAIRIYQIYLEKGMEADGTKYLEEALKNEASTPEEYLNRGKVYYYMEDYESARNELIKAANGNNTEALLILGMVYLGQKDISNARTMYQEYIAKVGSSAKGYNGLAQCDMYEGKSEEALVNISKGIEIASTEELQDLLFNEMVIYEKNLDFEVAMEKAQEYLILFPDDREMKRELKFLKTRTKYAIQTEEEPEENPEMTESEPGESEDYSGYDEDYSGYDEDYSGYDEDYSDYDEEYYGDDEQY